MNILPHPEEYSPKQGIAVLLFSVAILVLGNNLQGTLLGVRAGIEGMREQSIGLMMSAYYGGFVTGSILFPRLVYSVGHIRTFAALASIASTLTLLYILVITIPAWIILRFFHGLCYSGMILVIESWLNGCSDRKNRGSILASYGIVFWGCSAISQILLTTAAPDGIVLFCLISILVSFAMVPLTLAPSRTPVIIKTKRIKISRLFTISPLGVVGVLASGLCIGSAWGMGPVFAQSINFNTTGISLFMASMMSGTLISQWPLGRLSDKVDRRGVIVAASIVAGTVSLVLAFQEKYPLLPLTILAFLHGACAFPLYSLCVAHVNDRIHEEEVIGTAGTLIFLQGIGSASGPFASGVCMGYLGPQGLFFFVGTVLILLSLYGIFIITQRKAVSGRIKQTFIALPRISHVFLEKYVHRKNQGNCKKKKKSNLSESS